MDIKILDSWLREHLNTKATSKQIGDVLSLTSVAVDKIEELGRDHLYNIEVTTNRPDLMSVVGLAREATVALNSENVPATFIEKKIPQPKTSVGKFPVEIKNDPTLVHRICAAVLSVKIDKSPQLIRDRLEASDIRSINNVVDVTNYVMREMGHPMHAFDLDKLKTGRLLIREAKKGEKITTLDKKEYVLSGGEIVADDGEGRIVDLLGIMGTENSAVSEGTQRVLLFVDNNDHHKIRKASMNLGIRTEAAVLNEKGIDPELAINALLRGVQLLEEIAGAKLESPIFDEFKKLPHPKPIEITLDKINQVIGIQIPEKKVIEILEGLSFEVKKAKDTLSVTPPSARVQDVTIPEDVIEEVARIYGYHKLPNVLPPLPTASPYNMGSNQFYWEERAKNALKYWGFTEVYTSSLISEDMLEVNPKDALKLADPLSSDMVYLRTTLIPSLLSAVRNNKNIGTIRIFEMANIYLKKKASLPDEVLILAGAIKRENASFFNAKGIIEGLFKDLGISKYEFKKGEIETSDIYVFGNKVGEIEVLDRNLIDFELNFDMLLKYVTLKKTFTPLPKFPAAVEDLRVKIDPDVNFAKIVIAIKKASNLISRVELLDTYEDKKTFRITYQSAERNLTGAEITEVRGKLLEHLKKDLGAELA